MCLPIPASGVCIYKIYTIYIRRVYLGNDITHTQFNGLRSEYPGVTFMRLGQVTVEGFPDLWEPQHFAWKIWIYNEMVREAALQNTLIWYMDAGSIIVRWPEAWLTEAAKSGNPRFDNNQRFSVSDHAAS